MPAPANPLSKSSSKPARALPPLEDINLFSTDAALVEAVTREGGSTAVKRLAGIGLSTGSAGMFERGRDAQSHRPRLITHDRFGEWIGHVEHHSAYHDLLQFGVSEGWQASAWMAPSGPASGPPRQGVYVERAASLYMAAQADAGHLRPLTMTHSAVPALHNLAQLDATWLPKITARSYDRRVAAADEKASLLMAFAFAEQPDGSAGTIATQAVPLGKAGPGALYKITGRKGFVTAPASDAFLVLAQTAKGLSGFLVPHIGPGDAPNALRIRRLKDAVGLHACAVAEIGLDGAQGWLLGEDGRGASALEVTMLHARFDTVIVLAGLMRQSLAQALHAAEHAGQSSQASVADPLMQQTLADLVLDMEAAAALGFRLARAFDRATDARAAAWRRLMTPVSLYWVSRRAPVLAAEAMECSGENGCSEDWPFARLLRDCVQAACADGTASMMARDVLRILQREPDIIETVMDELGQASSDDPHLKAAHARVEAILHEPRLLDARGRLLAEALAVLAAGTILRAHAPAPVADAFIMTRLGNQPRQTYGHSLDWADTASIVRRASPHQG